LNSEQPSPDTRSRFARAALENVTRAYPNAPGFVLRGPEDLREPREIHPAFYGSFDWHSSVHMHWSLVRLLSQGVDAAVAQAIRDVLAQHLSSERIEVEREYLETFPWFERPYGWGWALALVQETLAWNDRHNDPPPAVDLPALERLGGTLRTLLLRYLTVMRYPNRAGTHGNSAFALLLALRYSRFTRDRALETAIGAAAFAWYGGDRDAPFAYEPSGEDFLSPVLVEAHLMADVLGPHDFVAWFERFLPAATSTPPDALRRIPRVGDEKDGRVAHLFGLRLSRAWNLEWIAASIEKTGRVAGPLRQAAAEHRAAGLAHVLSGNFETDHWLVSFALLATEDTAASAPHSG
jgi:hypothetical protein